MSYNLFQTVFRDSRFRGEIATDRSLEMHDHMTLLAMDVLEELVMPNCLFANSLGGEKQSDMMSPNEMDDYPSGEKTWNKGLITHFLPVCFSLCYDHLQGTGTNRLQKLRKLWQIILWMKLYWVPEKQHSARKLLLWVHPSTRLSTPGSMRVLLTPGYFSEFSCSVQEWCQEYNWMWDRMPCVAIMLVVELIVVHTTWNSKYLFRWL